jgi:radical SAM superfamily enzyme
MMLDECRLIDSLPLRSVKFHQLQMIKGTRMAQEFKDRPDDFVRMGLDEYLDFIVDVLERLRPDLYVERIAGEVPPRFLDEMQWGRIRNVEILRMLDKKLISRNTFQGKLFKKE